MRAAADEVDVATGLFITPGRILRPCALANERLTRLGART